MEQWISDNLGTIIALIGIVIGYITGYVKLQLKSRLNEISITLVKDNCYNCKEKMETRFKLINSDMNKNILKIHDLISLIKNTISSISSLLSKISGILLTYLQYYNKTNVHN